MRKGLSNIVFILGVVMILLFIFFILVTSFLRAAPTIKVADCFLTSNTIGNYEMTSITLTLVSNDDENAHQVRVEFSSQPSVIFMLGYENLSRENDIWYYTETLNPSALLMQSINVTASLESGIDRLNCRIIVIFLMDGEQFERKDLDLTVQR